MWGLAGWLYATPVPTPGDRAEYPDSETGRMALILLVEWLGWLDEWSADSIETTIREVADDLNVKPVFVFQVVRVVIMGSRYGLPVPVSLETFGQAATVKRLAGFAA